MIFGIEQARKELFQYISHLSDQQALTKPNQEDWSIIDSLEHLYVIEKLMTDEINLILKKNERKVAFQKPLHSTVDRSKNYKAPENMKPKHELTSLAEAKEKLTASRRSLLETLNGYDFSDFKANSGKHPAFGTINVEHWIEFIGLHELRHLEQIKEIVKGHKKSANL